MKGWLCNDKDVVTIITIQGNIYGYKKEKPIGGIELDSKLVV